MFDYSFEVPLGNNRYKKHITYFFTDVIKVIGHKTEDLTTRGNFLFISEF